MTRCCYGKGDLEMIRIIAAVVTAGATLAIAIQAVLFTGKYPETIQKAQVEAAKESAVTQSKLDVLEDLFDDQIDTRLRALNFGVALATQERDDSFFDSISRQVWADPAPIVRDTAWQHVQDRVDSAHRLFSLRFFDRAVNAYRSAVSMLPTTVTDKSLLLENAVTAFNDNKAAEAAAIYQSFFDTLQQP